MSYKRHRSESNVSIDHDDDCIVFNAMGDMASESDMNEPESPSPGIIWFEEQNSSPDAITAEICDNNDNNNNNREFVIDEQIITKYFVSAIQSHYHHPKLVTEHKSPSLSSDTMLEHTSTNSDNIGISIKSWEPKEMELPIWAVIASQK